MNNGVRVQARWITVAIVAIVIFIAFIFYHRLPLYENTLGSESGSLVCVASSKKYYYMGLSPQMELPKINRWTGAEEVKYTDTLVPARSRGWHITGHRRVPVWLHFCR